MEYSVKNPPADWTIYIGRGAVTTGWLWFGYQNPVVYAQVENTGTSNITDLVVRFGNKQIQSPGQSPESSVGFYINSSQIPQHIDISWKVHGQSHHETIGVKSMVEVD